MGGDHDRMDDGAARQGRLFFFGVMLLMLIACVGPVIDPVLDQRRFATFLFIRQDALIAIAVALVTWFGLMPGRGEPGRMMSWMMASARRWWLMPVALLLLCWAGHHLVFQAYPLIRDEQMGLFDAFIYAHGRIGWPIPPDWRGHAEALNLQFILPVAGHRAWLSDYLPGNAIIRMLVGMLADPGWTNPALTAIGAVALWRIACRLWPDDASARCTVLLLYCGSSQIVIMGMSGYAMPGYLALNLIWLALFLRGGKVGHAGAMLVGVLANGWHQPIFHPLFVLPFLAMLGWQRRWRLLTLYGAAYLVIGLGWLAWPHLAVEWMGGAPPNADRIGYGGRILSLLSNFSFVSLWLMAMNLLRFVTWQHLLLAPLALAGIYAARRDPLTLALAAGLVLPVIAATILLAYQGHGWGYRYLHGVIGNACLLGGHGWGALKRRDALPRWSGALHLGSFLVLLPIHAVMAAGMAIPYAGMSRTIAAMDADVVVIDDLGVNFGADLVFNRPDLANRPIRLMASKLDRDAAIDVCHRSRVMFVGKAEMVANKDDNSGTAHFMRLRRACTGISRAIPAAPARIPRSSSGHSSASR